MAPCTNVHELVGWFEEAKRVGHAPLKTVRFLFAFPHGMQYVRLSLAFNGYDRTTTIVVDVIQEEEDDE